MIKSWNYTMDDSAPKWAKEFFVGIDMKENNIMLRLNLFNFWEINFSYSYFKNIKFGGALLTRASLNYCIFNNVHFICTFFMKTSMLHIKDIINPFFMESCQVSNGVILLGAFGSSSLYSFGNQPTSIPYIENSENLNSNFFNPIGGLLTYGHKNKLFNMREVIEPFQYKNEKVKQIFLEKIEELIKEIDE
jgi:hypothetical protein